MSQKPKGETRVRIHYPNRNEQHEDVHQTKGVIAALIDNLDTLIDGDNERSRCAAIAQTKLEEACMWSVKALTTLEGE